MYVPASTGGPGKGVLRGITAGVIGQVGAILSSSSAGTPLMPVTVAVAANADPS